VIYGVSPSRATKGVGSVAAVEVFANAFSTRLSAAVDASSTTILVSDSAPAGLVGSGQFRILIDQEYLLVTGVSGPGNTIWSVSRGTEGSSSAAHSAGAVVSHIVTAGALGTFAQSAAPNVFTQQQTIRSGSSLLTTDEGGRPLIGLAATSTGQNANAASINLYGANALGTGGLAWQVGVDTAQAVPYQSFFVALAVGSSVYDQIMLTPAGSNGSCNIGLGATPPHTSHKVTISGEDANPSQGGLRIRIGPTQTGHPFSLFDSAGTERLWFDGNAVLHGNSPINGAALDIRSPTNTRAIVVSDPTGASYSFGFLLDAGGYFKLRNVGIGVDIFTGRNTSFQVNAPRLAFYGQPPVAQPTGAGITSGFTPDRGSPAMSSGSTSTGGLGSTPYTFGDIVLALKQLGAIAS
jgi:hypothetical protein